MRSTTFDRSARATWGAALLALTLVVGILSVGAPNAGAVPADILPSGSDLPAGSTLQSSDGRFVLAVQTDGHVVLYAQGTPTWRIATYTYPGYLAMQGDGNLVFYTVASPTAPAGLALWSSGTAGNTGAFAALQDDGNFVIYSADGRALWSSGTAGILDLVPDESVLRGGDGLEAQLPGPDFDSVYGLVSTNRNYILVAQMDGNLVLYRRPGVALWQSGTANVSGPGGDVGVNGGALTYDGLLFIQGTGATLLWSSGTSGNPGAFGVLQDDGNFVIYSADGRALWQTGTYGR